MQRIRPIELFLMEIILFLGLWFWNEYAAFLVSLLLGTISFFVLLISLISEWLERTKVPRAYFWWIGISCLVPLLVLIFMGITSKGAVFEWMF